MSSDKNIYEKFRPQLYERLAAELDGAQRILDFGCGQCGLSCFLARQLGCKVIGVDVSEDALAAGTARTKSEHVRRLVRCERIDASRLDEFADDSFDAAVSVYALHEMDKPVLTLREVARVVKPQGKTVIADFPKGSEASRLWHEAYYTPGQVRSMASRAGLSVSSLSLLADGHLLMLTALHKENATRPRIRAG